MALIRESLGHGRSPLGILREKAISALYSPSTDEVYCEFEGDEFDFEWVKNHPDAVLVTKDT